MEETQIKGNIFENGLSLMEIGVECWAIPAIDLLPPSLWMKWSESEVKWKVKVKSESIFGPLFFFQFLVKMEEN